MLRVAAEDGGAALLPPGVELDESVTATLAMGSAASERQLQLARQLAGEVQVCVCRGETGKLREEGEHRLVFLCTLHAPLRPQQCLSFTLNAPLYPSKVTLDPTSSPIHASMHARARAYMVA